MVARNKSHSGKDQHNAILVAKQQASVSAQIDPLMAAFNAIALMSRPYSLCKNMRAAAISPMIG